MFLIPNKNNRRKPRQQQNKGSSRPKRRSGPKSAVTAMSRSDTSTVVRMIPAPLFPPRSRSMMLPYYSNFSLSVPNTTLATGYVLCANGLYDPDISGTGGQPMGFDQMMLFYEHYTVTRATLVATFRNLVTANCPGVSLSVKADNTLVTDPYSIMEQGNTVQTILNISGAANNLKELRIAVDVKKFLGIDDLFDSSVARGDIGGNPSEGLFFHINAWSLDTAAAGTVTVQFRLEFHAVFSELRVISRSLAQGIQNLVLRENALKPVESKTPAVIRPCR